MSFLFRNRAGDTFKNVTVFARLVIVMFLIGPFVVCFSVVFVKCANNARVEEGLNVTEDGREVRCRQFAGQLFKGPGTGISKTVDDRVTILGMTQSELPEQLNGVAIGFHHNASLFAYANWFAFASTFAS